MDADNIIKSISEAAYGEINHHIDIFRRTSDIDNYLRLMSPDILVDIIMNACENLADVGMDVMAQLYRASYDGIPYSQKNNLQPSYAMHKEFKSALLTDSNKMQMDIDQYAMLYKSAVNGVERARKGTGKLGGAAIGGVIGSLFGPVGTFLGSMAGTAIVDGTSKDEALLLAEKMAAEYKFIVERTNLYLKDMANRAVGIMQNYDELLNETINCLYR